MVKFKYINRYNNKQKLKLVCTGTLLGTVLLTGCVKENTDSHKTLSEISNQILSDNELNQNEDIVELSKKISEYDDASKKLSKVDEETLEKTTFENTTITYEEFQKSLNDLSNDIETLDLNDDIESEQELKILNNYYIVDNYLENNQEDDMKLLYQQILLEKITNVLEEKGIESFSLESIEYQDCNEIRINVLINDKKSIYTIPKSSALGRSALKTLFKETGDLKEELEYLVGADLMLSTTSTSISDKESSRRFATAQVTLLGFIVVVLLTYTLCGEEIVNCSIKIK